MKAVFSLRMGRESFQILDDVGAERTTCLQRVDRKSVAKTFGHQRAAHNAASFEN